LDQRGFAGALGIVDDDFDGPEGRPLPSPNLVATDIHDLECILLRSPALERVLAEYGDPAKIQRFEATHGTTVRGGLIQRGLPFGRLRWLALRLGWGLPFAELRPERFIDPTNWWLDRDRLHTAVVTTGIPESAVQLDSALASLPEVDPWCVCQGHDLIAILRLGLQQVLGDLKPSQGTAQIAALLRAAYDERELYDGALGRLIQVWQSSNVPYQVLAAGPHP